MTNKYAMTVKELIEALSELPDDYNVQLYHGSTGISHIESIRGNSVFLYNTDNVIWRNT